MDGDTNIRKPIHKQAVLYVITFIFDFKTTRFYGTLTYFSNETTYSALNQEKTITAREHRIRIYLRNYRENDVRKTYFPSPSSRHALLLKPLAFFFLCRIIFHEKKKNQFLLYQ